LKNWISACVKLFCQFVGLFPRPWVRKIGGLWGWLWIDLFEIRKKVLMNNLNIAFPEKSESEKWNIARESVYHMGYNFAEFFLIPSVDEKWLNQHATMEGLDNVTSALEQKKGVFFLSLHLGNADMALTAMAFHKLPVNLITKTFKNSFINDLWFSIRGYHGVKYIDAHASNNAFEILKVLRSNEIAIFVLDQFMGKPFGILTRFFGVETGTAYGLALFYLKTKSPIVISYTYEGEDQKMHIVFQPALELDHLVDSNKDESILRLTQLFNDKLEEIVRRYPHQWMWVHRRWKDFE